MLGGALGLLFHSTNLGLIIGGGLGLLYLGSGGGTRRIHIRNTPSNVDAVRGNRRRARAWPARPGREGERGGSRRRRPASVVPSSGE
jgi:hypothetical protein